MGSGAAASARDLATLLAMKAVGLVLPATRPAPTDVILEARRRLADHLPPFWAAMLRLTSELRKRIEDSASPDEVLQGAQDIVDVTVLPALLDLKKKLQQGNAVAFFARSSARFTRVCACWSANRPLRNSSLL